MDDGRQLLSDYIARESSQVAVCRAADCSQSHLSLYLAGKRGLSVNMAEAIAAVTGIPAARLLGLKEAV